MNISLTNELHETHLLIKTKFSPQIIIPELARAIGLEESIALLQINYWLQRSQHVIDGSVWIYNTFEQWQEQFSYWSLSKIKRIFNSLHQMGLLISQKKKRFFGCHTKWYRIDYQKFYALLEQIKPAQQYKKVYDMPIQAHANVSNSNKQDSNAASQMPYTKIITDIVGNLACQENDNTALEPVKSALVQNGLSSGHFDTIITDTSTNITKSMSNDANAQKKSSWLNVLRTTRQTFSFLNEDLQITDQLMQIWSEIFPNKQKPVLLHDRRRAKLLQTWQNSFAGDIDQWREFCLAINSSKFLMGEKKSDFKAHFDWLIEEKTIAKIRAGEFDIGDRIPDIEQQRHAEEKAKMEAVATAKLAELQAQKQQAAREAEIKLLAGRLEWQALAAIEEAWTEEELEAAKQDFEKNIYAEGDPYGLDCYKNIFEESGWTNPLVNFAFTSFKRSRYLPQPAEFFLKEAVRLCNNDVFTSGRNSI